MIRQDFYLFQFFDGFSDRQCCKEGVIFIVYPGDKRDAQMNIKKQVGLIKFFEIGQDETVIDPRELFMYSAIRMFQIHVDSIQERQYFLHRLPRSKKTGFNGCVNTPLQTLFQYTRNKIRL